MKMQDFWDQGKKTFEVRSHTGAKMQNFGDQGKPCEVNGQGHMNVKTHLRGDMSLIVIGLVCKENVC